MTNMPIRSLSTLEYRGKMLTKHTSTIPISNYKVKP